MYIGWGAHEDKAPWYGWMMGYTYNGSTFTQTAVFNTTPNKQEGGIWMSGGAPAADSSNNLYITTGNGQFDATSTTAVNNDYGDTVLKLTSNLTESQYFTPSNYATLYANDGDLGAGGATVLPDLPAGSPIPHLVVAGGKDEFINVLNRDQLGGLGDAAAVQKFGIGASIFGTGAFWNHYYYVAGSNSSLSAYLLNASVPSFSLASTSRNTYSFPGSTPSVSAAGHGQRCRLDSGQQSLLHQTVGKLRPGGAARPRRGESRHRGLEQLDGQFGHGGQCGQIHRPDRRERKGLHRNAR